MEINPTSSSTMAMAASAQQLQTSAETQVAILKEIAEVQQQVAQMLAEGGLGRNLDLLA